uniref:AttH domain-containing protein n=1 Tax=Chromera velia CCMP2878 TaxID=1169474 RepID=A0A0G4FIT1_9ALVE|eukprot:Cvel_17136.t1-p1 / transcript=Cvel_17136.t1 / gene=Cvel_17136 / organism=Chromera_velia_CCMP2878 / gene_product=hypothetical protein / transcript_product=hypothetical protein / location=Cvel_scaffold1352:44094-45656(+) / protein_length=521 / sequence_SO=supercontig / SO=protein_coding / is_pseudo=false
MWAAISRCMLLMAAFCFLTQHSDGRRATAETDCDEISSSSVDNPSALPLLPLSLVSAPLETKAPKAFLGGVCCKHSNEATLVKDGLFGPPSVPISAVRFPKTLHHEFDVNAWCYFGQLKGQKGIYSLVWIIQKSDPTAWVFNTFQVGGGVGFREADGSATFDLHGCLDIGLGVSTTEGPWAVKGKCLDGSVLSAQLTGGEYGLPGSNYTIGLSTTKNKIDLQIEVTDVSGMVSQGNGPNSFLLNWVTADQRKAIETEYEGSAEDYQKNSGDAMECQGSYYFSKPNLKVNRFTLKKNGNIVDQSEPTEGTRAGGESQPQRDNRYGVLWFDYVAQTYNKNGRELLKKVGWQFFALSFPQLDSAIFVTTVETELGPMPSANLFSGPKKLFTWALDRVLIQPVRESLWTSPKSGKQYFLKYEIHLKNPDLKIQIETLWKDQEIGPIFEQWKYEGLGKSVVSGGKETNPFDSEGVEWEIREGDVFLELQAEGAVKSSEAENAVFNVREARREVQKDVSPNEKVFVQ